ncbi:MAG: archease [Candidatus Thorarchaeota archaeon]
MDRGFTFHDHTADITIECWAPSLSEAFVEAAKATFEVILDTSTVKPKESIEVTITGSDLEELLVEWIGELIALIDINGQFYTKFEVQSIEKTTSGYLLKALVWGELIDHEKHDTRTEVKAMTYADMIIDQKPERTMLRFTVDL